ncbi:hypothetical protein MLD38_024781 [Melastoma candidum]|uniref:Uncharacterized protein n=1 Tax=Melastoma candidum TaxID=119954 RepID=A0ACB9NV36_9MYRT|nr:hypothetical protein MLD38_024781 [Melastoma candidum]
MTSSTAASYSSAAATPQPYSGSEANTQNSNSSGDLIDQRKRKRMESNRESAQRSRMRKQKHVDDLTAQILHLTRENVQILTGINAAAQHLVTVEAENSVLRAQVTELGQRLQSLDEILDFICPININGGVEDGGFGYASHGGTPRQPIMAAGPGGMFQC